MAASRDSNPTPHPWPPLPPCGICGRDLEPMSVPGTRGDQWLCPVCGVEGEWTETLAELNARPRVSTPSMGGDRMITRYS